MKAYCDSIENPISTAGETFVDETYGSLYGTETLPSPAINPNILQISNCPSDKIVYFTLTVDGSEIIANEDSRSQRDNNRLDLTFGVPEPTNLNFSATGGIVVANYVNTTNTNFTGGATITAGEATGGYAEWLIDGASFNIPIKDESIAAEDTSVTFNAGLDNNADVQAQIAEGNHTLTVKLCDAAGNCTTSTESKSITADYTAPTIESVALGTDEYVNAAETNSGVDIVVTTSGVEDDQIVICNVKDADSAHTVGPLTGNILNNTVTIPTGDLTDLTDGTITATCDVSDKAGNAATPKSDTATKDTVAPAAPTIGLVAGDNVINIAERTVGVTVTGTTEAGTTVTLNGKNATVTGTTWTYTLTTDEINAFGQGSEILTAVATNAAGNTSEVTKEINVDTVAPTTTITIPTYINIANVASVPVTITSDENGTYTYTISDGTDDITGDGDITANTPIELHLDLSGLADTTITANVSVTDAAGNTGTAGTDTAAKDTIAPTVSITSTLSSPTNISPIPIIVTFSETVMGFGISDITVTNGTASNFTGSGATYFLDVTPLTEGEVEVSIAANRVVDLAENNNSESNLFSITYDNSIPAVPAAPTVTDPAIAKILNADNYTIKGTAEVGSTVKIYRGTDVVGSVTADATSGEYSISVALSQNAVNNFTVTATNSTGESLPTIVPAITEDSISPTVSIRVPSFVSTSLPITISSSEDVEYEYTVSGGSHVISGEGTIIGGTYSVNLNIDISSFNDGTITVIVTATDAAGNESEDEEDSATKDTVAPIVTGISVLSSTVSQSNLTQRVYIYYNEWEDTSVGPVVTFNAGTWTPGGGAWGYYQPYYNGPWIMYWDQTFTLTDEDQEITGVTVSVSGAKDEAGNLQTPYTSGALFNIDTKAPGAPSVSGLPASRPIIVDTDTLNIEVTAEANSLIKFYRGGTYISGYQLSGGATNYTFDLPLIQDSVNEFTVTATDAVGNESEATALPDIIEDSTAPSVVISSDVSGSTKTSPIPMTVTFSEPVDGFTIGDIVVTNGTADALAGGSVIFTFNVTPTADGVVTVSIPAGVAKDYLGKDNTASDQFSITYDATPPSVVISSDVSGSTKTSPIPMTVTFSEPVEGFDIEVITVKNGIINVLTGGPEAFTFNVTPINEGIVTVSIPAGVVTNHAGRSNTASSEFKIIYDKTAPEVSDSYNTSEVILVHTNQTITLSASDRDGSGVAAIKYCTGEGCSPATNYSVPLTYH